MKKAIATAKKYPYTTSLFVFTAIATTTLVKQHDSIKHIHITLDNIMDTLDAMLDAEDLKDAIAANAK